VVLYRPFHHPKPQAKEPFTTNLRWVKVPGSHLTKFSDDVELDGSVSQKVSKMKALGGLEGYVSVYLPGSQPGLIMKESSSTPKIFSISGESIRALCCIDSSSSAGAMIVVDSHVMPLPYENNSCIDID